MTSEQLKLLLYKIDEEGFDYCFRGYSSWREINDPKFHELRRAYMKAANDLEIYINESNQIGDDEPIN